MIELTDDLLNEYLDDELDQATRLAVESQLAVSPEAQTRLAELQSLFTLFETMIGELRRKVTMELMNGGPSGADDPLLAEAAAMPELEMQLADPLGGDFEHEDGTELYDGVGYDGGVDNQTVRFRQAAADQDPNDPSTWGKVSRNAECPCGSGKKYKKCHGVH